MQIASDIQQNYSLKALNTMALPVSARFFCECHSVDKIRQAVDYAKDNALEIWVLGGGSNVIFTEDFDGLVIYIKNCNVNVISQSDSDALVNVEAGIVWDDFLQQCLAQGWHGLENLAIIPGTVGAAPIQNIGAYGQEVGDCIESVEVIDVGSGQIKTFSHSECEFAYRDSLFKKQGLKRYVITSVNFRLQKTFTANLSYKALKDYLDDKAVTAESVREAVINIRRSKLPEPEDIPNTGSFFKNPIVSKQAFENLIEQYPEIPHYPQEGGQVKLAAGWLIEQAGFKGKQIGPVAMYEKQALVLVNNQGGNSADVLALKLTVQGKVNQLFGVELEQEPIVAF